MHYFFKDRGVLRDHLGHSTLVFLESMGIRDSNEEELLGIMRALCIWADLGGVEN